MWCHVVPCGAKRLARLNGRTEALTGMQALLNYTAGAMIYVRREYSERINILRASWIAAPCTVQICTIQKGSLALYSAGISSVFCLGLC